MLSVQAIAKMAIGASKVEIEVKPCTQKIAFGARKVIGTFEKRAPGS